MSKALNAGLILWLLASMLQAAPYQDALDDAAIEVERMDSIMDDSLIIGNGDINSLVWNDNGATTLMLTKNDVWDARLLTHNDPPLPTLKRIKELGAKGGKVGVTAHGFIFPEGYSFKGKDSYHSKPYPCPILCGKLVLGKQDHSNPKAASGKLDISKAVVTTGSTEIRALAGRNIFLIRTGQSVELVPSNSMDVPEAVEGARGDVRYLHKTIPGDLDWKGMEFAVAVAEKGDLKAVAIVTSFEAKDVVGAAVKAAKATLQQSPSKLISKHEKIWKTFWSRSGLKIDDELLQRTWYRGLYFLRCITKPGVQCPGLFASLKNNTPAWHGDYHTNYNLQQVFWAAYAANQTELIEPYGRLIREYMPRGRWLAKQVYGMDGVFYPHVMYAYEPTSPETCKSRNGRQYIHHMCGLTLGVSGFTVQPVWWHYKYAPDKKFLKDTAYPLVREVAAFYVNFIEQCQGDDKVLLGPTFSPEHHGWMPNLSRNYNCSFDIAMIRYTLSAAIEGAKILGKDQAFVKRCQAAIKRLPDYPLGGKNNSVVVDVKDADPITYNIPVPATPVFPGDVVSFQSPSEQQELFKRTIESLRLYGFNDMVMMAVSRARLSMDDTMDWLKKEVHARTRPNGTITLNPLKPFSKYNNHGHYAEQFGTGIAVSEMLIQSVDDIIRLFPAWPKDKKAEFDQLRTQGGFLVSAKQNDKGEIGPVRIQSTVGGPLSVVSPWKTIQANGKKQEPDAKGIILIETRPGEMIILTPY